MSPTKAPAEMTAEEALLEYGFTQEGDTFYKAGADTQTWVKVDGGWICLEAPRAPLVVGAEPWGRPYKDSGLIQVPWRQAPRFEGVGGLHPLRHQDMFDWVWSDERVREIHAYGYTGDGDGFYGRRWKRNAEGDLVPDRSPRTATLEESPAAE